MESREYITYSRRGRAGERPQSASKLNQFHGYRSTKQWVEEVTQQCIGVNREQHEDHGDGRSRLPTPSRAGSKKKDGRVHFKQENEQTVPKLAFKVACNTPSVAPANIRKDCLPDSEIAALSPISLNVAAGSRQAFKSIPMTKQSPVGPTLPLGVPRKQDQIDVMSPDVSAQIKPSERDNEERPVVWCNAAFEADDDLRSCKSQDSVQSSRLSNASCSKHSQSDVNRIPAPNQSLEEQTVTLESSRHGNANIAVSVEKPSLSPAFSTASAVAGSSPATVMTSPDHDGLPRNAQLELEATAGDWYTPFDSETASQSCRGIERTMDLSKTRRTLAAMPAFKAAAPPTSSNADISGVATIVRMSSAKDEAPSTSNPRKNTPEQRPHCELTSRSHFIRTVLPRGVTPPRSFTRDTNGPRIVKKTEGSPAFLGMTDHCASGPTRTTPKQRTHPEAVVEADLQADIEQEIEDEIAKEIFQLSQRLAALHARQQTRRLGVGPERSKTGGIVSCPQTPLRSVPPSSSSSDSVTKRKGRVVAAKFLQYKNDKSNVKNGPEKSVDRTEKSTPKHGGLTEGQFVGRVNPPRRSLGTPARLLTRGKATGQPRTSSPNHVGKEDFPVPRLPESETQCRWNTASKLTTEEYVRDRALLESGNRRVAGMISCRKFGDEERKDWNQWNDRAIGQNKKEHQAAHGAGTGSAAVQSQLYPEFERKLDWVKTLRTGSVPAACTSGPVNPAAQALDEKFLKQKSERQDIHAWLREHVGNAEGTGEIPSFGPPCSGTRIHENAMREVPNDMEKTRMIEDDDPRNGVTPSRSTRPNNPPNTPVRNAGTTPNRSTPTRTTPSSVNARIVPSRYGTPVKAASVRIPESRCVAPEGSPREKRWCGQSRSPSKRSKENKVVFPMRKISPTFRRGYPGTAGLKNSTLAASRKQKGALKHDRGTVHNDVYDQSREMGSSTTTKVERKITVVEAEYEKLVDEAVTMEKQVAKDLSKTGVDLERGRGQGIGSKTPSPTTKTDACEPPRSVNRDARPPSTAAAKPAKKIFIRCSDLIKDKHLLMKNKQKRCTGQSVLPSEGQDSDDSVFARSNTRTDSSERDESASRSETSIIEETTSSGTVARDCPLFSKRGDVEGMQFVTGSRKQRPDKVRGDYDILYEYESRQPRVSSHLPKDYRLEAMLQDVDNLKREREGLPRIRAVKHALDGSSPRDSGCIKRTKERERRARFYFKAIGELPNISCIDNDGLSPNEIEGLDLESFWCLVGDLESPIKITRP